MDVQAVAALAGLAGLVTGAAAVLAFRVSEHVQETVPPQPDPAVPSGIATVLSVLGSSAVVVDREDRVVKASAAAHAFGLVRGDELVPVELRELVREVRRHGEIREADLDLPRTPGGSDTLSVSARVAPLGSALVLVLVDDHTQSRRIDAVRRDFVANVSHELKTPVGALSLLAEAVEEAANDPEAIRRFARRMQHESTRLTDLVQELIDLSRLQADEPVEQALPVAVDAVVRAALERSRLAAQSRDVTLATTGTRGLTVRGDEAQLAMALGNLVENAVNYSGEGSRVTVGVHGFPEAVEITVTDQGIGIAEAVQERIFERFYRVDPARSRATGGTGLGLSIVKHVVASHGGDVAVWSEPGEGSTFTLRLPAPAAAVTTAPRDVLPVQEARP